MCLSCSKVNDKLLAKIVVHAYFFSSINRSAPFRVIVRVASGRNG